MFCYPVARFPGGQKWKCIICFYIGAVVALYSAQVKRDIDVLSSDVLTGYTALVKREQVENDARRRIFQSIPDGAVCYVGARHCK